MKCAVITYSHTKSHKYKLKIPDKYVKKEYDHHSPEGLEDPVPVGLYIGDCEQITNHYTFNEESVVIGIPLNTSHLETTLPFIDYIFE